MTVSAANDAVVNSVKIGSDTYENHGVAGYGFVPFSTKDSRGDTLGGIGSSAAIEKNSWKKTGTTTYTGTLWGLPDRGFNVLGTINYQPRVHKFTITFDAGVTQSSTPNLQLQYKETVYLTDPTGTPFTGLDADKVGGYLSFPGLPDLPGVHYTGDGFGNPGPGGARVSLDSEGLVLNKDGTFWVSDEYGPYVYKFDSSGKLLQAIRPPDVFLPLRNGAVSFSADSPPVYDNASHPTPASPTQGRQNNQGFEGLTTDPFGKYLYVLLQSALRQDGGQGGSSNRFYTRFLKYNIGCKKNPAPKLVAEYVVKLNVDAKNLVDAQSEVHYLSDTRFLILSRDSGRGAGLDDPTSIYRQADIIDISKATNILGQYDAFNSTIVTNVTAATLKTGIVPAAYYPFINYNNNTELAKFGLHNGGAQDSTLLNEKWESFALVPTDVDDKGHVNPDSNEYFLFTLSDNDFRAKDVYVNGGKTLFHDTVDLENQAIVFKITLPKGSHPLVG
ncbi:3-phytase [Thozetella sp. PMI_491]|nr:3-phytase [Thozetella sp. PMI_491]